MSPAPPPAFSFACSLPATLLPSEECFQSDTGERMPILLTASEEGIGEGVRSRRYQRRDSEEAAGGDTRPRKRSRRQQHQRNIVLLLRPVRHAALKRQSHV